MKTYNLQATVQDAFNYRNLTDKIESILKAQGITLKVVKLIERKNQVPRAGDVVKLTKEVSWCGEKDSEHIILEQSGDSYAVCALSDWSCYAWLDKTQCEFVREATNKEYSKARRSSRDAE